MSEPTEAEVAKFMAEHEAQIASWPKEAREAIKQIEGLSANSFGRWLRTKTAVRVAYDLLDSQRYNPTPNLLIIRQAANILREHI